MLKLFDGLLQGSRKFPENSNPTPYRRHAFPQTQDLCDRVN